MAVSKAAEPKKGRAGGADIQHYSPPLQLGR